MTIIIKQSAFEILAPGQYPAVIKNIEWSSGQYEEQLKWSFNVVKPDGSCQKLSAWTSPKFAPKSKLYKWTVGALGGAPLDNKSDFNSDFLIGCRVLLVISERSNDKGTFNAIDDVLPFSGQGTQPIAPPAKEGW